MLVVGLVLISQEPLTNTDVHSSSPIASGEAFIHINWTLKSRIPILNFADTSTRSNTVEGTAVIQVGIAARSSIYGNITSVRNRAALKTSRSVSGW